MSSPINEQAGSPPMRNFDDEVAMIAMTGWKVLGLEAGDVLLLEPDRHLEPEKMKNASKSVQQVFKGTGIRAVLIPHGWRAYAVRPEVAAQAEEAAG